MIKCVLKFLFCDDHKGEYWYRCELCGKEEWFARYDKPEVLSKCPNN